MGLVLGGSSPIQLPMSHLWGVMAANLCGLNRDKLRDKRKRAGYYHNWVGWVGGTIKLASWGYYHTVPLRFSGVLC